MLQKNSREKVSNPSTSIVSRWKWNNINMLVVGDTRPDLSKVGYMLVVYFPPGVISFQHTSSIHMIRLEKLCFLYINMGITWGNSHLAFSANFLTV